MNIALLTVTWSHSDVFDIQNTSLYKSFKKFNPYKKIYHFHFNRGHYHQMESDFHQKFGQESEYLLYKIQLLLEKAKTVDANYIIFCDANDVTCLSNVDHLINLFNLEEYIILGHEKNMWPTPERKQAWPDYQDYKGRDLDMKTYLNSGMILAKKEKYLEMLQSLIDNVFSTNINTFSNDQGVYTYYYNKSIKPEIKLDYSNIFALNTFSRSTEEFYNHNNRLVSKETGVKPCFIHDNGWNYGSPKYFEYFNLSRTYELEHTITEYLMGDSTDYNVINYAIKQIKNVSGIICEIGTRRGGGTKTIIDSLIENKDFNRNIVCIDPYGDIEYKVSENNTIWGGYDNKMKSEFLITINDYILDKPLNLVLFTLEDSEFFKRFYDGIPLYNKNKDIINQYAFVFFDGPHDSDSIMKEIEFFNPRSVTGSVWVFDDVNENYPHQEIIEKWLFNNDWVLLEKTGKKASYKKI